MWGGVDRCGVGVDRGVGWGWIEVWMGCWVGGKS